MVLKYRRMTLSCLKSYVRSTMTQARLNIFALLNSHRGIKVIQCEVLDSLASQHKRKLQLSNILEADKC